MSPYIIPLFALKVNNETNISYMQNAAYSGTIFLLSSNAKFLDKGQIGSIDDKLLDYFPDYKNETVHTDGHSFTLCISTFGLILIT